MDTSCTRLPLSQAEIKVALTHDELLPYFEESAKHLSEKKEIKGFRPGRAPFSVVRDSLGMDAIWSHALHDIISRTLAKAVFDNTLETLGQPEVNVLTQKEDEFSYTAKVDLVPSVELGEYKDIKVDQKDVAIADEEITRTLDEVRAMRAKHKVKEDSAALGDIVELDMLVSQNGVVLEDGTVKGMRVKLGDPLLLKGFDENIQGKKKGDEHAFGSSLPDGRDAHFKVTINEVYAVYMPEVNDDFAKSLGAFENIDDLKEKIKENLLHEKNEKESQRRELAALDILMGKSTFGEFPPSLIPGEVDKMMEELKSDVEQQGGKFEDYLSHIKKTEDEIRKEMEVGAERRIKMALLMRGISKKEGIIVLESEIEEDINAYCATKKATPEILTQVKSPQFHNYIKSILLSKKVTAFVRTLIDGTKE